MSTPSPLMTSIALIHADGHVYHPCRMRDRNTGRSQFRVSTGQGPSNTKDQTIFVDAETDVRRFLQLGYRVRCRAAQGRIANLYSVKTRSILRVEGLDA